MGSEDLKKANRPNRQKHSHEGREEGTKDRKRGLLGTHGNRESERKRGNWGSK